MLLSNWEYDHDNIDIMNFFRISANAIYPFYRSGKVCFLRFTPFGEKSLQAIQAELEYLTYLRGNKYHVPEIIISKTNEETVVRETPWGKYTAVVFTGIDSFSHRLDRHEYSDELYIGYGEALGRLHLLSKGYSPKIKRPDWRHNLNITAEILKEYNAHEEALKEASILKDFLSKLPITPNNYGLIHYDFEPDNIFYNPETSRYGVIDFDDAMYHWYTMDVVQAVDSIKDELPERLHEQAVNQFMKGYRSAACADKVTLAYMPVLRRYANLYGYARCLRSLHEKAENEPDWMVELRRNIESQMKLRSKDFGEDIAEGNIENSCHISRNAGEFL
jgi:Ser/Thr protein kinase RdoA (MazF antagonist)